MTDTTSARLSGRRPGTPLPSEADAWPLEGRPGLLIRRLHQMHVALFTDQMQGENITPVQFSLLSAIAARATADQTTLAADVALDRSTAASTLARMEARGWVRRRRDVADGRAVLCSLTPSGRATLTRVEPLAREAHRRTLEHLGGEDAARLVGLLHAALPPD